MDETMQRAQSKAMLSGICLKNLTHPRAANKQEEKKREKGDRSPLTQKGFLANLFMLRCFEVSLQVLGSTETIDASVVKVTRYR